MPVTLPESRPRFRQQSAERAAALLAASARRGRGDGQTEIAASLLQLSTEIRSATLDPRVIPPCVYFVASVLWVNGFKDRSPAQILAQDTDPRFWLTPRTYHLFVSAMMD